MEKRAAMKKTVLVILIISAAAAAYASQFTKQWLAASEFSDHGTIWGARLCFKADGLYEIEYSSEGWDWRDSGTYEISGSGVTLRPSVCSGRPYRTSADAEFSMGEAEATITEKPDDLRYGSYLSVKSKYNRRNLVGQDIEADTLFFPVKESILKNARRSCRGTPVITMGCAQGVTVSNVKIRSAPAVSAESMTYATSHGEDEKPFVPEGTKVTVLARTVKKDRVKDRENYWYLVNVGYEEKVWMYGEFVRLID